MPSRARRRNYPRMVGVALPRKRRSFRAARARRNLNIRLSMRNLPQRRKFDYGHIKFQYLLGSNSGGGYLRLRRVYRPHTRYTRSSYPILHAVPFSQRIDRASIFTKQEHIRTLRMADLVAVGVQNGNAMTQRAGAALRFKFPGRRIP